MNTRQAITAIQNSLQFATKRLMANRQKIPQEAAERLYQYISTFLRDVGFQEVHPILSKTSMSTPLAGNVVESGIQTGIVDELCIFRGKIRQSCIQSQPSELRNEVLKICDEIRVEVGIVLNLDNNHNHNHN